MAFAVIGAWVGKGWVIEKVFTPRANLLDGKMLAHDLARADCLFSPIDPNPPYASGILQSALTARSAIENANKSPMGFQDSPDLTGIKANLGMWNCPGPQLVWIVTYEGIRQQFSGPIGANRIAFSNEAEVVIDAFSGNYLMALVWNR
jgi:hypothetical protein